MVQIQFMFNFTSNLTLRRLNRLSNREKLHLHFNSGVFYYHLVKILTTDNYGYPLLILQVRDGNIGHNFPSERMPLRDLY